MDKEFQAMGHKVKISQNYEPAPDEKTKVSRGVSILKDYKASKADLEQKIIDNEEWYKLQHWDLMRKKKQDQDPEPVTGYLFSVLNNKHGSAMDNYPTPQFYEREESDAPTAKELSEILPVILQRNEFKESWSDIWWYKLKQGFCFVGTFWDTSKNEGMGDITIKKIDALNVYWEPGITNLHDSRNIFITELKDKDLVEKEYPHLEGQLKQDPMMKPANYQINSDEKQMENKVVIVDWYTVENGRVDLCKFVDGYILKDTADNEEYPNGLYEHGQYPINVDVLFPMEGTPIGFGFIDVVRSPQAYIDKLDQIISKNALVSGKQRTMVSESLGVNMEQLKDLSVDFVECAGAIDESKYKEMQAEPLAPFIANHRESKIQELKEIAGDNQFSRGEAGKGITAASAIQALQEASNKVDRDMIGGGYRSYRRIIRLAIELVAEFYDNARKFRITKPNGKIEYRKFSNEKMKPQELPPAYEGEGMIMDPESGQMIPDPEFEPDTRKPIFDIEVRPEKSNPFSRAAMNEFSKDLYKLGFFDPQRVDQALMALELMDFEGKETIIQKISENGSMFEKMQQMKQTMDKMAITIEKLDPSVNLTGRNGRDNNGRRANQPQ
ncbi:MAG: hypothetical protein K9L56_14380 [Clostridiales bacterium]|nr:hypothetical protein [Clostridiales bacterium]